LSYIYNKPLIPVHHIAGHIYANNLVKKMEYPLIALVVSGGHTELIYMKDEYSFEKLGGTLDDAVGECYDKVAKCLGLGYPGGVVIAKKSKEGQNSIPFITHEILPNTYDFSFSGVKTTIINYVHKLNQAGEQIPVEDICASFQTQAVEELVKKSIKACQKFKEKTLVVGGGVSANSRLRDRLKEEAEKQKIKVYFPELKLSGDNGAMIASEGYYQLINGLGLSNIDLSPAPNINLKYVRRKEKF